MSLIIIVIPKRARMPITISKPNRICSAGEASVLCIREQDSGIEKNSLSNYH